MKEEVKQKLLERRLKNAEKNISEAGDKWLEQLSNYDLSSVSKDNIELIQKIVCVFKEYDDYVLLYKGIDDEEIFHFEQSLNIKLPSLYKDFLKVFNGGELFSEDLKPVNKDIKIVSDINKIEVKDIIEFDNEKYLSLTQNSWSLGFCLKLTGENIGSVVEIYRDGDTGEICTNIVEWLLDYMNENGEESKAEGDYAKLSTKQALKKLYPQIFQ